MLPDHAGGEPDVYLLRHVDRVREEEWRQQNLSEHWVGREHIPERDRDDRDHKLQREQAQARHQATSACA
jgi:hypothetical protein